MSVTDKARLIESLYRKGWKITVNHRVYERR